MEKVVAERKLLYSQKGETKRKSLIVKVSTPHLVDENSVDFAFAQGIARCTIEFDGIPEKDVDVFGADTLQALNLATDVEGYLKGLQKKYDLFWLSGEPYFDE